MYIDRGVDNIRGVMGEILFGKWDEIKVYDAKYMRP
jgi:hypothetical protein